MSTVDVNSVIVTGENSVIRLNNNDNDAFTTQASFWRILTCPAGPGDVLYLKSELTEDRWRIYSDNIAMARWLQSTVVGAINAELLDLAAAADTDHRDAARKLGQPLLQLLAVIIRCRLFDLRPDLVGAGDDVFFLTSAVDDRRILLFDAHALGAVRL